MISTVCVLNIFSSDTVSGSATLKSEINDFLKNRRECQILGGGRSCIESNRFDIEVAFESEKQANVIIRKLQSSFANRCDLDVDWI